MSITDELREWAGGGTLRAGMSLRTARDQALAIADRIDAEHKRKVGCTADEWDYWESTHIELPKDADGTPLDEYDFVEVIGEGYVTSIEWFALKGMEWYARLSAHTEFCADGSVDKIWMSNYVKASELRKKKPAPTVEDVLREFGRGWHERMVGPETFDIADYVERYAAKLMLKED